MKKFLLMLLISAFLIGCVGRGYLNIKEVPDKVVVQESMKTLSIPGTDAKIKVPEKAPDFLNWQGQVLGANKFSNGNAVVVVEHFNDGMTVDVMALAVLIEKQISIVSFQVAYCEKGFAKLDINKPIEKQVKVEYYEDLSFMKTGKISGVLVKVDNPTDFEKFRIFIEGTKI